MVFIDTVLHILFPSNGPNTYFIFPYLFQINGERNPQEVYNDFRVAILRIIGAGTAGNTGDASNAVSETMGIPNGRVVNMQQPLALAKSVINPSDTTTSTTTANVFVHKPPAKGYPTAVYVIGN